MSSTAFQIEESVLSQNWASGVSLNPILETFFSDVIPKFSLLPTSVKVLQAFSRKDVKSDEVALILRTNPYLEEQVGRFVESLAKRQDKPSLEAAIVLLGMQNTRNLVIAIQMKRLILEQHPVWDQNGKMSFAPKDALKYAIKAEEPLATDKEGFAETAFAAGFIYDSIFCLAEARGVDKKVLEYIEILFKHAMRSAAIGKQLHILFPDFALKKYAYSACLVHNIGQALLLILDASYLSFIEEAKKKEVPNLLIHLSEEKLYGVTSSALTSMICRVSGIFSPLETVMQFQATPLLLKEKNKQAHQLALHVCLANAMARHFKKTADPADPIVGKWKAAELGDFAPATTALFEIIGKVQV